MKRKKKPIPLADSYKTVKTSLKSILLNFDKIQPEINKLVIKCNDIVVQTYQFIRLFILHKYHNGERLPEISEKFVLYALKTQGTRDNRGRKAKDSGLLLELKEFYDQEFQPLIKSEKFDLKNLSYLLPYIAIQITTCYQNNITEHYIQYLLRFINKTTVGNKSEQFKVKKAVVDGVEPPQEYQEWFDTHKKHIIPEKIVKSLPYDLKAYPSKFLPCMIYMNSILEKDEHKLFQPLPLRNNIVPKYITIDTACLINFFAKKGQKGKLLQSLKNSRELIWRQIFKLDKKVFKSNQYSFNYQIQTDGIGISLSFIRNDLVGKKYGTRLPKIEKEPYNYIEDCLDAELKNFSKRNIVGVDPGKKFLLYMVDDSDNTLKYSAPQRRAESMGKRSTRILLNEKNKNKITEKETKLSEENCRTTHYKKFKKYIKNKTKLNTSTRNFYIKDLWRKMKWRRFVYSRKSDDVFLNKISDTFGEDCVLAYGDWSRSTQMKHFMPTKNIGMRRLVHKRFDTVSVGEYNTSKKCCDCHGDLEYVNSKTIRLLQCSQCLSFENKKKVYRTRDANSAVNIKNLFKFYCRHKTRPKEFTRSSSALSQSKVEQSVDFTGGKAPNL